MSKIGRGKRFRNKEKSSVYDEDPISIIENDPLELAQIICMNSIFCGNLKDLIIHLKEEHGLTFEQIKIGMDEIRKTEKNRFTGWEAYF